MTDEQVIKALECCASDEGSEACNKCPFNENDICDNDTLALQKYALDLIKRQQAEIERLKEIANPKCQQCVEQTVNTLLRTEKLMTL